MQEEYKLLAERKRKDVQLQVIALLLVIFSFYGLSVWAFYILAFAQSASGCYWHYFFKRNNVPQYRPARNIRKTFFIVLALHALCLIIFPILLLFLMIMLFAGPILGTSYLLITLKEIAFYRGMKDPYGDF